MFREYGNINWSVNEPLSEIIEKLRDLGFFFFGKIFNIQEKYWKILESKNSDLEFQNSLFLKIRTYAYSPLWL